MTATSPDNASPAPAAVTNATNAGTVRRRRVIVLLPLAAFVGLAMLFAGRFVIISFDRSAPFVRFEFVIRDVSAIPSALIGHEAPSTDLPAVVGLERDGKAVPGLATTDFKDAVTVVNVWASWCIPCHDEAPLLLQLAGDPRIRVVGINYKDEPANARRFLGRYGNPFAAAGADANGRAGIEWGVYGVPETFIVGRDGKIAYKLVGPITPDNLDGIVKPQIEKALAGAS